MRILRMRNRGIYPTDVEPVWGSIKTDRRLHDWQITGGYDPEQDGEDERYARYAVQCKKCKEERRVGATFDDFIFACSSGCIRTNFNGRFQRGDLVTVEKEDGFGGERLDHFLNYVEGDMAATSNAGGGTYIQPVSKLKPYGGLQ